MWRILQFLNEHTSTSVQFKLWKQKSTGASITIDMTCRQWVDNFYNVDNANNASTTLPNIYWSMHVPEAWDVSFHRTLSDNFVKHVQKSSKAYQKLVQDFAVSETSTKCPPILSFRSLKQCSISDLFPIIKNIRLNFGEYCNQEWMSTRQIWLSTCDKSS